MENQFFNICKNNNCKNDVSYFKSIINNNNICVCVCV